MTENQKIADILAKSLITGVKPDPKLMQKLINNLCEDYKKERQRGIPRDRPDVVDKI